MRLFVLVLLAGLIAAAQEPDPARGPLEKAYESLRAEDLPSAIQHFRAATELAPERAAIWKDLGYALLRAEQPQAAIHALRRARDLDAGDEKLALDLAFLHQRLNQPEEALRIAQGLAEAADESVRSAATSMLQAAPSPVADAPEPDAGFAAAERGFSALKADDIEGAIAAFGDAVAARPERLDWAKQWAYALIAFGDDAGAAEVFERCLERDAANEAAALDLAFAYVRLKRSDEAQALFRRLAEAEDVAVRDSAREQLVQNGPEPTVPFDPAYSLADEAYRALDAMEYARAATLFRRALALAPERVNYRKELAYAYLWLDDLEAAAAQFAQAVDEDPDDRRIALELGYTLARMNRWPEARGRLQSLAAGGDETVAAAAERYLAQNDPTRLAGTETGLPADPGYLAAARAYDALRARDYDTAIRGFEEAFRYRRDSAPLAQELGYAYLKIGETERAREWFERVTELAPGDENARLELAFLSYETGERRRAYELFRGLVEAADERVRTTAAQAYASVDSEWRQILASWLRTLEDDPTNQSVHIEVAEIYEVLGRPAKSAEHYLHAWYQYPRYREELLLPLAQAREEAGDISGAIAARLLASYSQRTRLSERAKDVMPLRFPYASEFRLALAMYPEQWRARRDLGYLLLEVGEAEQAIPVFEDVTKQNPEDNLAAAQLAFLYLDFQRNEEAEKLLEAAAQGSDEDAAKRARETLARLRLEQVDKARQLGEKSLQLSYLRDARDQFLKIYELNPADDQAAYKLGVVHNLMREDREAMRWFKTAMVQAQDPQIAGDSRKAYRNLSRQYQKVRTSVWMLPFYSSRFSDVFAYSQIKTELRLDKFGLFPYVSLRFVGDVRQRTSGARPQLLSESAIIPAIGLRTKPFHGLTLWGEAGQAISYLTSRPENVPRAGPDYRGGASWFFATGKSLGQEESGRFFEANADGVFISRFDNDFLTYFQGRPGYRLPNLGILRAQVYANLNITADVKGEYWANFVEFGPGVRVRVPGVHPPMDFRLDLIRGVHTTNKNNPQRPNYFDVRAGVWYSFSR